MDKNIFTIFERNYINIHNLPAVSLFLPFSVQWTFLVFPLCSPEHYTTIPTGPAWIIGHSWGWGSLLGWSASLLDQDTAVYKRGRTHVQTGKNSSYWQTGAFNTTDIAALEKCQLDFKYSLNTRKTILCALVRFLFKGINDFKYVIAKMCKLATKPSKLIMRVSKWMFFFLCVWTLLSTVWIWVK